LQGKEYELNKIIDARNEEGKNQYSHSEVSGHNDHKPEPSHATAKRIIYRGMYPNKNTL